LPAAEVKAGVKRLVSLGKVGDFRGAGAGAGQLLDLEVLEAAFGAFRFQREVALARIAFTDARDDLAVDGELDDAVVGLDAVVVPLAAALAAILAWQAALPAQGVRTIGFALG